MDRRICFPGVICLLALLGGLSEGCVSSPIKRPDATSELPQEFPAELKDKFEIKEINQVDKKPIQVGKRQARKRRTLAAAAAPFQYPVRRGEKTPIWVYERLVFGIHYLGISAGDFTLEVLPFKKIDGRKVYHIRGNAVTSALSSLIYRVNDSVESFFDFDGLFSHRFHVVLDETKQTRDSLELNDSEKKQTYYWSRWNHKVSGYKETKELSPIEPFSQDSLSALYYARTVPLTEVGTTFTFPVISEGKSWDAVCTFVRREVLSTPMGKVSTVVIRPEMKYQGILKKAGDSFLWLTDDDRRLPVRLEAKVRIGTVSARLKEVTLGHPPGNTAVE